MQLGFAAFALLAINPVGGLTIAIPFGVFKLHYPAWLILGAGIPLSYAQVLVVSHLEGLQEELGQALVVGEDAEGNAALSLHNA